MLARDCRSRVVTVEGLLARFLSIFMTNRSSSWQNLEITSLGLRTEGGGEGGREGTTASH